VGEWFAARRQGGLAAGRHVQGINAATDKATASFQRLLSFESGLQSTVRGMPNNTDADREARMLAWVRGMRNYNG
jgi:hypothetical protein